jgi:Ca2+-binding RTX toxin-like protein
VGGGGRDRLIGNGAANTLLGGGGADTLIGNAGNDILNGGGGADSMSGGVGNDLYVVDNAGDVVTELADGGIDTLQSSVSRILGDQQENLTLLGTAAINATGNALNNVLQGNAGNNILDGGAGSDTASYAFATAPVNVSLALAGAQATGGAGTDTLIGIENLRGGSGADTVTGNAGANALFGGAGADTLRGGGGADRFVFDSRTGADLLLDFASGVDRLQISQAQIRVGDGDTLVEGGVVVAGPGGFAPGAELVILTGNISGAINATAAAARIGSAGAAYAPGQTGLFAVDNGVSSALFLFTAADANALVAATELRLLGSLSGTAATVLADYQFVA